MPYTPGPWRQSNDELGYGPYDILADQGEGLHNLGIATVIDLRFSNFRNNTVALHREVAEANARLIAAAPELFEICKQFTYISKDDNFWKIYEDIIDQIQKVIQKVEGI